MKSLKEKELLVKFAIAMGETPDANLVNEINEYKTIKDNARKSIKENVFKDLANAVKENKKPKVEVKEEPVVEPTPEPIVAPIAEEVIFPVPPTVDELLEFLNEKKAEEPVQQIIEVKEVKEAIVPVPKEESALQTAASDLISKVSKSDSYQQPDPIVVPADIPGIQKKLKFLEQWISKVSMAGPGGGAVKLKDLDDVSKYSLATATNNQVLSFNAATKLWVARSITSGGGGIAWTDLSVTINTANGNGTLTYDDSNGTFAFTPANVIPQVQSDWTQSDPNNISFIKNKPGLTTANVSEVTNLYFTNTRAIAALTAGSNIIISANGQISSNASIVNYSNYSTNVTNITNVTYFTNVTNVTNVTYITYGNSQIQSDWLESNTSNASYILNKPVLNTANITESNSNLYYTNARVYANVIQLGYLTAANLNGLASNSQLSNYLTAANLNGLTSNTQLSSYATVSNLNLKANVVDLNTANVAESNSNLYYTNARVYANVIQLGYLTSANLNGLASNSQLSNYLTAANLNGLTSNTQLVNYATTSNLNLKANIVDLTTANVIESASNLYYTNARVYANVIQLGYLTAANLDGLTSNTQLVNYATVSNLNLRANIVDLTTANVIESSSNLYYTNARVYANVIQLGYLTAANLNGLTSNTQLVNYATTSNLNLKANVVDLKTANVIESASNLYYTNARVVSAVSNTTLSNLTVTYAPATAVGAGIVITAANTVGGGGYADVLKFINGAGGSTNNTKTLRLTSTGTLQLIDNVYANVLLDIADTGIVSLGTTTNAANNIPVNNSLRLNGRTYLNDDGNFHLTTTGGSIWLNSNDGGSVQVNMQMPAGITGGGMNVKGTITGNGAGGTSFVSGSGANNNIALQISPGSGAANQAIRDTSTVASTMYFDVSTGGSANGTFQWRSSSSFTTQMQLDDRLTVNAGRSYTIGGYGYLATSGAGTSSGTTATYGVYAANRMQAAEFDATSDERVKDIQGTIPIEKALQFIRGVDGIIYTWKSGFGDDGLKSGFSAQAVHKAGFDHMIGHIENDKLEGEVDDDGWTHPDKVQLTMGYNQAIPYHHEAIKYLLDQIESLKSEIAELKSKKTGNK